jgi:ABC-type amino acid transport substrate-binding protein
MAKIVTIGLVVIMLVVGFAAGLMFSPFILPQNASSTTDAIWNHIQQTGVIRVGTDPTWPPYEQLDNVTGEIVGFEVDLANACAAKLNLTIEWQIVDFGSIILSVQQGTLDMGVSGFSIKPVRLEQVSFTIPHSVTTAQVIMLQSTIDAKHITTINSLEDLKWEKPKNKNSKQQACQSDHGVTLHQLFKTWLAQTQAYRQYTLKHP